MRVPTGTRARRGQRCRQTRPTKEGLGTPLRRLPRLRRRTKEGQRMILPARRRPPRPRPCWQLQRFRPPRRPRRNRSRGRGARGRTTASASARGVPRGAAIKCRGRRRRAGVLFMYAARFARRHGRAPVRDRGHPEVRRGAPPERARQHVAPRPPLDGPELQSHAHHTVLNQTSALNRTRLIGGFALRHHEEILGQERAPARALPPHRRAGARGCVEIKFRAPHAIDATCFP